MKLNWHTDKDHKRKPHAYVIAQISLNAYSNAPKGYIQGQHITELYEKVENDKQEKIVMFTARYKRDNISLEAQLPQR